MTLEERQNHWLNQTPNHFKFEPPKSQKALEIEAENEKLSIKQSDEMAKYVKKRRALVVECIRSKMSSGDAYKKMKRKRQLTFNNVTIAQGTFRSLYCTVARQDKIPLVESIKKGIIRLMAEDKTEYEIIENLGITRIQYKNSIWRIDRQK